ncbi:hypothetical protein ACQP2E_17385 [Actinoplanes sp. CA-015351]
MSKHHNLRTFLADAENRGLLRRNGGEYRFADQLIRDHLAR